MLMIHLLSDLSTLCFVSKAMISVLGGIMIIGGVGQCFRNVLGGFILGCLGLFLVRADVSSRLKRNSKKVSRK